MRKLGLFLLFASTVWQIVGCSVDASSPFTFPDEPTKKSAKPEELKINVNQGDEYSNTTEYNSADGVVTSYSKIFEITLNATTSLTVSSSFEFSVGCNVDPKISITHISIDPNSLVTYRNIITEGGSEFTVDPSQANSIEVTFENIDSSCYQISHSFSVSPVE